jgi:4-hydroxybenzoate polyprenyltransferase
VITRIRLVTVLTRPAVVLLLAMFTATGAAQAGQSQVSVPLALALMCVAGFLLFSVACNDLADEAIDRINLPGKRPLAAGLLGRREFVVIGGAAGAVALAAGALIGWRAVAVVTAGMAVSAGYSLRPVRLADRGAVASMALPACYVAVPYLLGVLAAGGHPGPGALALLGGLYLGFTGRIVLKDFRDVRGDALFGKRTFLIRHGRVPTCVFSGGCWLAGTIFMLAATRRITLPFAAAEVICLAGALVLLRALAADLGGRRDEAIISAIAIVGRAMVLLLLAHLSMRPVGSSASGEWTTLWYDVVIAGIALTCAGQAWTMARRGPVSRLAVPAWPGAGSEASCGVSVDQEAGQNSAAAMADGQRGPSRRIVGNRS